MKNYVLDKKSFDKEIEQIIHRKDKKTIAILEIKNELESLKLNLKNFPDLSKTIANHIKNRKPKYLRLKKDIYFIDKDIVFKEGTWKNYETENILNLYFYLLQEYQENNKDKNLKDIINFAFFLGINRTVGSIHEKIKHINSIVFKITNGSTFLPKVGKSRDQNNNKLNFYINKLISKRNTHINEIKNEKNTKIIRSKNSNLDLRKKLLTTNLKESELNTYKYFILEQEDRTSIILRKKIIENNTIYFDNFIYFNEFIIKEDQYNIFEILFNINIIQNQAEKQLLDLGAKEELQVPVMDELIVKAKDSGLFDHLYEKNYGKDNPYMTLDNYEEQLRAEDPAKLKIKLRNEYSKMQKTQEKKQSSRKNKEKSYVKAKDKIKNIIFEDRDGKDYKKALDSGGKRPPELYAAAEKYYYDEWAKIHNYKGNRDSSLFWSDFLSLKLNNPQSWPNCFYNIAKDFLTESNHKNSINFHEINRICKDRGLGSYHTSKIGDLIKDLFDSYESFPEKYIEHTKNNNEYLSSEISYIEQQIIELHLRINHFYDKDKIFVPVITKLINIREIPGHEDYKNKKTTYHFPSCEIKSIEKIKDKFFIRTSRKIYGLRKIVITRNENPDFIQQKDNNSSIFDKFYLSLVRVISGDIEKNVSTVSKDNNVKEFEREYISKSTIKAKTYSYDFFEDMHLRNISNDELESFIKTIKKDVADWETSGWKKNREKYGIL